MFVDLVGSTPLSERLDPEDLQAVIRAYQETCAGVVVRYDGHVAQYLGDGLLIYFGYPQAHEDDAGRAVHAGLGIVEALDRLNARLEPEHGVRLSLRIGVHSGPVVVGEAGGEGQETQVVGRTMNLTARLQGVAEPDSVVISGETLRLVQGLFRVRDLGAHALEGVAEPVAAYRVEAASGVQSRLDVGGLTPLVGREQEVALLLDRFTQAREGQGQVVLLGGEAGVGKSRLVQVLRARLAGEPHTWLTGRGSPYHQNSALHAAIEVLTRSLSWEAGGAPKDRMEQLEPLLEEAGLEVATAAPLLATLLSLPIPERYPPLQLSPEACRRRTLEILVEWLLVLAETQPVVLVIEDLHWVDPSTLELLGMLVDQAPTVRLLLLLSFRPSFEPSWVARSHLAHLTLNPLTREQVGQMVERIAGGKRLPAEVVTQIVARTDGVPLFVEELTRTLLESELLVEGEHQYERTDPLPELAVPSTLRDSLMARLDRLGETKEVAQLAAVLGREFSYQLIQEVADSPPEALEHALARLVDADLLYQRGVPPRSIYSFKHALIRDTAYESMLRSRRRDAHRRIAGVLEILFPEASQIEPELLAHHYEAAGSIDAAIEHYERAGMRASRALANEEAVRHLSHAIRLLRETPVGGERDRRELTLQVSLGAPLQALRGYADPEVERAYARARELCQRAREAPELSQALWGLSAFHCARGELDPAIELATQLLERGETSGETGDALWGHLALGNPLYWRGDLTEALRHLDAVIAEHDPEEHAPLTLAYGQDPAVIARCYAAAALWHQGFPDRARERSLEALERGRDCGHPYSLTFALAWATLVSYMRGDTEEVRRQAEETILIAEEQGFPFLLGMAKMFRAWVATTSDRETAASALDDLRHALGEVARTGVSVGGGFVLGLLAEGCRNAGRIEDAARALVAAFAMAQKQHSPFWNPELHRMQGELDLLADPDAHGSAEDNFRRGLRLARSQGARSFELRLASSLSELLARCGKHDEARRELALVYAGFQEGLGTRDLKRARALLD